MASSQLAGARPCRLRKSWVIHMRFVRVSRAVPLAYLRKSPIFSPGTAAASFDSPIAPTTATRRNQEMMRTLYGIFILRIPLQPWDHIAFALSIKKAPPDHRFSGDCPIVPPPATLYRYCQNRLKTVCSRLLLFWTICVHQVCYAPAMRIYLRLSVGVAYVNPPSSSKQHYCNCVTAYTRVQPVSNVFTPAMTIESNASGFYAMMDTVVQ